MNHRYNEWISYIFNHPATKPEWCYQIDIPQFIGIELDYIQLIGETFKNSGTDLADYSDAQVNQGLWYMISPASSDYILSLTNGERFLANKIEAIQSIADLYETCFSRRCTETLGHINESGASELNSVCYMFWDIFPIPVYAYDSNTIPIQNAILSVLQNTLKINHRACIEGALHGLAEMSHNQQDRVASIIDEYLKAAKLDEPLLQYALRAKTGGVL